MSLDIPKNIRNSVHSLPAIAEKSTMLQMHAAMLMRNGTPMIKEFNTIKGGRTFHAEVLTVISYLKMYGFKFDDKQPCILHG